MPKGVYPRRPNLLNPKPKSKPKPKPALKTKTGPICAETFHTKRRHAQFCSNTCLKRHERGSIPSKVQGKADELRAQRNARAAASKAKRDEEKANQRAYRAILEKARELYLATYEQGWNEAITAETDPVEKAEMIRLKDQGLARIASAASVPDRFMKTVRDGMD